MARAGLSARWRWLWLAMLGVALGLGGWLAWPTPAVPPLPDEPANAAQVLAKVRQGIAAAYAANCGPGRYHLYLETQLLIQALHADYPESTRRWLLRHLLGPERPPVPGISDYDLCFLAPRLVTSAALRQSALTEIVLPQVTAPPKDWRRRAIVCLGLELQCSDPRFLRLAYDTVADTRRWFWGHRHWVELLEWLDEWRHWGWWKLTGKSASAPLLSATYERLGFWYEMTEDALRGGSYQVPAATFLTLWTLTEPQREQYALLLQGLSLSPADERQVLAQIPEAYSYLRVGRRLGAAASLAKDNDESASPIAELEARRPRLLAEWERARTAEEALAVLPALILLANEGDTWLAAFFQRWPDYYYQPPADPEPSRYSAANLFGGGDFGTPKLPAEMTPVELLESLHSPVNLPPHYRLGYDSQKYLAAFWPAEQALLARAPEWQPLAQAWRSYAGRPWPPELWAETWDAARERLHASPDAEAAQYAGLLLAQAWTLTDPRAAERRFHPDWPERFGGPLHRWCAAAVAADLLPEHTVAADRWVKRRRLSEGQGLVKAIVWQELFYSGNSSSTTRFLDLANHDYLPELMPHGRHPSLYSEQAWLDCRRWLATQGDRNNWPLNYLTQLAGYRRGVYDHYLPFAEESGLDADHPILPQPYYELIKDF